MSIDRVKRLIRRWEKCLHKLGCSMCRNSHDLTHKNICVYTRTSIVQISLTLPVCCVFNHGREVSYLSWLVPTQTCSMGLPFHHTLASTWSYFPALSDADILFVSALLILALEKLIFSLWSEHAICFLLLQRGTITIRLYLLHIWIRVHSSIIRYNKYLVHSHLPMYTFLRRLKLQSFQSALGGLYNITCVSKHISC